MQTKRAAITLHPTVLTFLPLVTCRRNPSPFVAKHKVRQIYSTHCVELKLDAGMCCWWAVSSGDLGSLLSYTATMHFTDYGEGA